MKQLKTKSPLNALQLLAACALCLLAGSSPAQVTQMLYATNGATTWRDNYTGGTGCKFTVGSSNVIVSYLGYLSTNTITGLNSNHYVGVYSTSSGTPLLGQVVVPAGTSAYYTNGFYWVQLNPPLLLSANTAYYVAALPYNGDGDYWLDSFSATFNTAFVGTTAASTRATAYGPGNANWPIPSFSTFGSSSTYCVEGLGYIEVGSALAGVLQSNASISAGSTLTVNGCSSGQTPVTNQWWKAGSPNVLVSTTNSPYANLVIPSAGTAASGTYFLTSSNALGGAQSVNVNVTVTAYPVGLSKQPTNVSVFNNYPVTISVTATGTPPIYYQWSRNGQPISGATASSISFFVSTTNSGDVYSCLASNYVNSTPYTATTSNAVLTVLANLAQPQEFLHGYKNNLNNNTYQGQQGGEFTVGNNPVLVTHLGYYAWPANTVTNAGVVTCTLTVDHNVGVYNVAGVALGGYVGLSNLLGSVDIPAGSNPVINGYMWAPLDPPLVLTNGATYLLVAQTESDADWGDTYAIPDLNPYFASSCAAIYGGNGWGSTPYLGGGYSGQMYSAPNMAVLALPTPTAFVSPLATTQYVGLSATFQATVAGQAPVTVQWGQEPGIILSGQTNASLTLSNLTLAQSNNLYFVIATNLQTAAGDQSTDAVLDVTADVGPSITTDIQGQVAYVYQTVQFVGAADGTPPLSYQWTFNGQPIPGATTPTLTLNDVTTNYAGNYQLLVTNSWGSTNTSVANLQVITPAWGGYASGVMTPDLLLYYRFSDITNFYYYGVNVATNQGSLGPAANGTYEGNCSQVEGPTNIVDLDEPTNWGVGLDGFTADVLIPSETVSLTNCTIAAWVQDQGGQADNSTIFFHRQGSVFGLAIGQTGTGEWLKYTWNNNFYNNNTGLILPTNQWAFVAMVVNPTNAAIYLFNGTNVSSTNFAGSYPPQTLSGASYIAWDTAGGSTGRRWLGDIDEVMVLNEAYSPEAVRSLYLGVPASATLTIAKSGANLVVSWPGGTLQEATSVSGPWTPTVGASNGSYVLTPTAASKFYRVKLQ